MGQFANQQLLYLIFCLKDKIQARKKENRNTPEPGEKNKAKEQ